MSKLYDEIVSQRGSLERLVAGIPGFKGYQDKQARREADTMLRDHLATQLKQKIDEMIRIEKVILNNDGLSVMSVTRNVKGKLARLHDEMKAVMPGYSGMWARIKIGEDELEQIYSFDEAMIGYINRIDKALTSLSVAATSSEDDSVKDALKHLDDIVSEALEAYSLRHNLLTNLDVDR